MLYKMLADVVVLVHFLWIAFLCFGPFLGKRNQAIKIFHVSGLFFALIIQVFDWYCPLTHLEVWLRSKHAPDLTYTGSFIIHYVEKIVYIDLSPTLILLLTLLLCGFNVWFYLGKKR